MPTEVIMPKVDMDMASGKISTWHVAEGAQVERAAPLFDIETDKAAMEVESPATGTLHHTAPIGTEVAIGAPVAWIYAAGEEVADAPTADPTSAPIPEPQAPEPTPEPTPEPAAPATEGLRMTPAARTLARDHKIDPQDLKGSGPRARIQRSDVEAAITPARPTGHKTPFVLLHGFAADASAWALLEPLLPTGHPIHKLELPGHGRAPQKTIADFADLAAQMRKAFDALETGPVHLIGHSLGGAVALALADTRPRKMASLTLISPAGLGPQINGAVIRGIAKASKAESLGPWVKMLTADPEAISWNFVQAAAALRRDPELRATQLAMAEALFPDDTQAFDLHAALHRVDAPLRLIWGKRDRIIPWDHALRAPGRAALHLFENVGHLPQMEVSEEIAGLLHQHP